MLTDEQKAKLTPGQIVIAEKWMEEDEKVRIINEKLTSAIRSNDQDAMTDLVEELFNVVPASCEHNKSVWESCSECLAIEIVIHPERYDSNGERITDF